MNKLAFLFGAAVALVVLIDLATGQGPPVYTQYLQAHQQAYPPPPPPAITLQPVGYVHRGEYEPKEALAKEAGHGKHGHQKPKKADKAPEYEKIEKNQPKDEYKDKEAEEKEYYDEYKSTPAPGVLSSLSNSMSGAWNRISSFGRATRSVDEPKAPIASAAATGNATTVVAEAKPVASGDAASAIGSQARGMDSYELLHQKSNGYIYFKVPKHLVCGY